MPYSCPLTELLDGRIFLFMSQVNNPKINLYQKLDDDFYQDLISKKIYPINHPHELVAPCYDERFDEGPCPCSEPDAGPAMMTEVSVREIPDLHHRGLRPGEIVMCQGKHYIWRSHQDDGGDPQSWMWDPYSIQTLGEES